MKILKQILRRITDKIMCVKGLKFLSPISIHSSISRRAFCKKVLRYINDLLSQLHGVFRNLAIFENSI